MSDPTAFEPNYRDARQRFLDAAKQAGAELQAHAHPRAGRLGEELALDTAWLGPRHAKRVLVSMSGVHGVEGIYGNACQVAWLRSRSELPRDTAVLMLHAVNPFGFSWLRRVNEDHIDVNRNCIDWSKAPPVNPMYDQVHPFILPDEWTDVSMGRMHQQFMAFVGRVGPKAAAAAATGGQYTHPDGIFYGGSGPCWSNRILTRVVTDHLTQAAAVAVIDHHTGLGASGHTELICRHPVNSAALTAARQWYGRDVTSPAAGESESPVVDGSARMVFVGLCPNAAVVSVCAEVGTRPQVEVISAVIADNWLHQRGVIDSDQGDAIRAMVRDAFFVNTAQWRESALSRSASLYVQAFAGLSALA